MMNNENGRSMVEMLGVLAIIGVLSVAGIAGYSMAMKRYRANEIIATASTFYVLADAQREANYGFTGVSLSSVNIAPPFTGVDMNLDAANNKINITGVNDDDICAKIEEAFDGGKVGFEIGTCS